MAFSSKMKVHEPENTKHELTTLRRAAIVASAAVASVIPISLSMAASAAAAHGQTSRTPEAASTTTTTTTIPSIQPLSLPQIENQISRAEQYAQKLSSELPQAENDLNNAYNDINKVKSNLSAIKSELPQTGSSVTDTLWKVAGVTIVSCAAICGAAVLIMSRMFRRLRGTINERIPSGKEAGAEDLSKDVA